VTNIIEIEKFRARRHMLERPGEEDFNAQIQE
jgi:hypothetical protein